MKWSHHTDPLLAFTAKAFARLKGIPLLPMIIDEQLKLFTFIFRPRRFMKMQEFRRLMEARLNLDSCYHRFGGLEFRYDGKEVAHLHSDGLLDIMFPKQLASLLIEKGMTGLHHVYPDTGWTSTLIQGNTEVQSCFLLVKLKLRLQKKEIDVVHIIENLEKVPL